MTVILVPYLEHKNLGHSVWFYINTLTGLGLQMKQDFKDNALLISLTFMHILMYRDNCLRSLALFKQLTSILIKIASSLCSEAFTIYSLLLHYALSMWLIIHDLIKLATNGVRQ